MKNNNLKLQKLYQWRIVYLNQKYRIIIIQKNMAIAKLHNMSYSPNAQKAHHDRLMAYNNIM